MKVFADASAWLAIEIKNDYNHKRAVTHKTFLERQRARIFTNDYVLAETYTRLIYDKHLKAALEFYKRIMHGVKQGVLTILEVEQNDQEKAWEELNRYTDQKLSFTDATIVVHFKTYRLDNIFTFDKHFRDINLPTNLS